LVQNHTLGFYRTLCRSSRLSRDDDSTSRFM